jgi:hypothetical protein
MAAAMEAIPELVLKKPDGSLLTRIEAEAELWDKCKTSHMMRRLAWGRYGLDQRFTWILKPTSVTHWVLDELSRKKFISGDPIGVQPELESDDSYFSSFVQRLKVFVEEGRALAPKEGEGINMSDFQHPGPMMMPQNGQQPSMPGFAAPPSPVGFPPAPPPMGAPQFQQPQAPVGFPPQAPPPMGAPQAPQGYPPAGPQFGAPQFGAQPQQPAFPPQAMPAPGAPPPMMQPQGAPPAPPAQAPANRRGRGKTDAAPAPGTLPGQQQLPMGAPPQGFGAPPMMPPQFGAPQGMPQMGAPQQMAPQTQQAPMQQGGANNGELLAAIAQLKNIVEEQGKLLQHLGSKLLETQRMVKAIDIVSSISLRGFYNAPRPATEADLGLEATFKAVNIPYPS